MYLSQPGSPSTSPKPVQPYTHGFNPMAISCAHNQVTVSAHAGCIRNFHLIVLSTPQTLTGYFQLPSAAGKCLLRLQSRGCDTKRQSDLPRTTACERAGDQPRISHVPRALTTASSFLSGTGRRAKVALKYGYKTSSAMVYFKMGSSFSSPFISDLAEDLQHGVSFFVLPIIQPSSVVSVDLSPAMRDLLSCARRCESLLEQ